jgi:hypothetical protein
MMIRQAIFLGTALALAGCASSPPPQPVVVQQPVATAGLLQIAIAAPASAVRSTLIERARSRGAAAQAGRNTVTLEAQLPETSEALARLCGPHQPGRRLRVVISTEEGVGQTIVTERRFVMDGAASCPIQLTEADRENGMRSMAELKAQVEARVARR